MSQKYYNTFIFQYKYYSLIEAVAILSSIIMGNKGMFFINTEKNSQKMYNRYSMRRMLLTDYLQMNEVTLS